MMLAKSQPSCRWSSAPTCQHVGVHAPGARRARVSARAFGLPDLFNQSTKKDTKELLKLLDDTERGLKSNAAQTKEILEVVDRLKSGSEGTTTTGSNLSATWKLLWTTEKVRALGAQQLLCTFMLSNASV
jgi:hypothetical protein